MSSVLYLLLQFEVHKETTRRIFFPTLKKENACNKCFNEKGRMHSAVFCLDMFVKHGQVSSGISGIYEQPRKFQILGINATNGSMIPHTYYCQYLLFVK